MSIQDNNVRWDVKLDVFRPTTDFSDLLKIVACYYEMYSKCCEFIGPWMSKQHGKMFIPPDSDQLKLAIGKERPAINFRARTAFINSVIQYLMNTKGRKTLVTPNPSSHHSAQFPAGTFDVTIVADEEMKKVFPNRKNTGLRKIEFFGAQEPVYVERLTIAPELIQFIILRPKLGKLGTPSTSKWEVLVYKKNHGYLVEHVDSHLNPRFSGIF